MVLVIDSGISLGSSKANESALGPFTGTFGRESLFFFSIGVNQEWNLEQLENNMYKEPT